MMNYFHLKYVEDLRLNFDWGWGRYEYINSDGVFCSFVGIPLEGIPAHHFHPHTELTRPEQFDKWVKAVLTEKGCRS